MRIIHRAGGQSSNRTDRCEIWRFGIEDETDHGEEVVLPLLADKGKRCR